MISLEYRRQIQKEAETHRSVSFSTGKKLFSDVLGGCRNMDTLPSDEILNMSFIKCA